MPRKTLVLVLASVPVAAVAALVLGAALVALGAWSPGVTASTSASPAPGEDALAAYESAVGATIRCLEADGVEAIVRPGRGQRPTAFAVRAADPHGDPATSARLHEVLMHCRASHLEEAESRLRASRPALTADAARALFERMEACIRAGGPDRPEHDGGAGVVSVAYPQAGRSLEVRHADGKAYFACALAEEAASGYHAPSPTWID